MYREGVLAPLKSDETHDVGCDIPLHLPIAKVVWVHVRTLAFGHMSVHYDRQAR